MAPHDGGGCTLTVQCDLNMKKVASCIPAFLGVLHYVTTIAKTPSFITKKSMIGEEQ